MHRHHRRSRSKATVSKLELTIFIGGLIAAVIAGVVAYQIVGLYGDGPFSYGYRRIRDPETGKSLLVHESRGADGRIIRRVIDNRTLKEVRLDADTDGVEDTRVHVSGTEITRIDQDRDGDGRIDVAAYYDANKQLVKAGFSLAGDGVVDAWAYRDANGQIIKIEVSRRRDNTVDRWEYYEKGQLARVEEDTDRDGRLDRWSTYEEGILINTVVDANNDGQPDAPPKWAVGSRQ